MYSVIPILAFWTILETWFLLAGLCVAKKSIFSTRTITVSDDTRDLPPGPGLLLKSADCQYEYVNNLILSTHVYKAQVFQNCVVFFLPEKCCGLESEKGVNSILITILRFPTNFLKRPNFLLSGILFGSSRGSFSKKNLSKTDPSDFVKLGSEILYLFLAKNCRLFVLSCCNFARCLLPFFKLFPRENLST